MSDTVQNSLYITRKKGPRLGMILDIFILLILSVDGFELIPLNPIIGGNNSFTFFLLWMAVMYVRNMGFSFRMGIQKHIKPVYWLLIGVLLSFIPAYIYYRQGFYLSFTVNRRFLCYLLLPLLLSIRPTKEEIRQALYVFAVLYVFVMVFCTLYTPQWITVPEHGALIGEGDYFHVFPGERLLVLGCILALDDFRERKDVKRFVIVVLFLLLIYVVRSRSALIAISAIIILAVLFNKSARTRLAALALLLFGIVVVVILALNYIDVLIEETLQEIQDPDSSNRMKALIYMFSFDRPHITYYLGTGLISGNVHPLIAQLQDEGIYASDVGIIGSWHQFGIVTILPIIVTMFKGFSRKHSFLVRANALFLIMVSATLAYVWLTQCCVWLCIFWYLYATDEEYVKAMEIHRQEVIRKAMRRFRSLTR